MVQYSGYSIQDHISITTDGYHYDSVLKTVSSGLNIQIRRQRCLFHIEKDPAHRISDANKEADQVTVLSEWKQPEETREEQGRCREALRRQNLAENCRNDPVQAQQPVWQRQDHCIIPHICKERQE